MCGQKTCAAVATAASRLKGRALGWVARGVGRGSLTFVSSVTAAKQMQETIKGTFEWH